MLNRISNTLLTISLIILLGSTACKSQNEKDVPAPEDRHVDQTETTKTTLEKLQGRWMSLDDASNVIEFSGSTKTEYYDDQVMETSEFEILEKCKSGFSNADVAGEFIDDGELCHKIEELTDQTLILIYMDRGNTLRYKKL